MPDIFLKIKLQIIDYNMEYKKCFEMFLNANEIFKNNIFDWITTKYKFEIEHGELKNNKLNEIKSLTK